jgi:hypothetical protein
MQVAIKTVVFQEAPPPPDSSSGGGAAAEAPRRARGSTALERAIAEGAITLTLSHAHVVSTYYHEIKPLQVPPASEGSHLVDRGGVQVRRRRHAGIMLMAKG